MRRPTLTLRLFLSSAAFAAFACATPKSAADHRDLAAAEEAKAAEHMARYDEEGSAVALRRSELDPDVLVSEEYNPTHWEKAEADAHSRAAEKHRAAARALEESEDAACSGTAAGQRSACPLFSPTQVTDIARGVRVTFADESTATRAAAVLRCQQAFAAARGFRDLPSCAIYARKLELKQDGAVLDIEASDAEGVARLRANVRGHHVR